MCIKFQIESPFTFEQEKTLNEFANALESACDGCDCDNCIMKGFCREHSNDNPGEIVRQILRILGVKPEL